MRSLHKPLKHNWSRLTALITCLMLAPVSAQETTSLPPVSADSTVVEAIPLESSALDVSASPDTGFWFLSTQNSPQSFDRSCPRFCPGVSRYDECCGFHSSSLADLTASIQPGVPVCIVVHGSFVDNASACRESQCVWQWLRSAGMGEQMQMIYFSWPSYRRITPLVAIDVNALGRRAERNGYYLAELIQHLPADCPVCLIGHSHGARVVAGGLHLLAGGAIQGVRHPYARTNGRAIRTVFAAAALDHHWLCPGKRYDRALCSTQCLLNMYNRSDPALKIYPLRLPLISKRPIGLAGLSQWDRRRLGGWGNRIVERDVTRAVGRTHVWPYYFRNSGIAMMMRNYVYFPNHARPAPTTVSTQTIIRR